MSLCPRSMRSPAARTCLTVLILCAAAVAAQPGCTRHYVISDAGPQAYYQTGFPIRDTSGELERIAQSLRRVAVTAYYTTYRFAREDSIADADLRDPRTLAGAREQYAIELPKAGTGSIIAAHTAGITLITNDHVTRTPDTVVVHYPAHADGAPRAVESVSIRTAQHNFVHGLPDSRRFTITARDSAADLALIHVALPNADRVPGIRVLRVPMGDASRLAWGSFVYVLGFPRGHRMVTRGIVSDPGFRRDDGFVLDGMFNRGISGGPILAVRGDTGALEWVGLATSAAADVDERLRPESRDLRDDGLLVPYEGLLYLERVPRILYGITYPVTITTIRRFLATAPR